MKIIKSCMAAPPELSGEGFLTPFPARLYQALRT